MENRFEHPPSIEAAVSMLGKLADEGLLIAGGTWVMRAPLRDQDLDRTFVSLAKIAQLHVLAISDTSLDLGALVTHDELALGVASLPEMGALAQAAGKSANPAIRRMATIGGNIATQDFHAADLVPALIALGAHVDVQAADGPLRLSLTDYIAARATRPVGEILTHVSVPRQSGRSAHARGLMRQAGEYPVANLSLYLEADAAGAIAAIRIAVGAVEAAPKRWHALEQALGGQQVCTNELADLAARHACEFSPRDAVDSPGWYRLRLLPRLFEQAFGDALAQIERDR